MCKTFIDKRGLLNHLIPTGTNDIYFSYENIVKNSKRLNPWNEFFVKLYAEDGTDLIEYTQLDKSIFQDQRLIPITRKFNPEFLI